jgi:hypothetical protein
MKVKNEEEEHTFDRCALPRLPARPTGCSPSSGVAGRFFPNSDTMLSCSAFVRWSGIFGGETLTPRRIGDGEVDDGTRAGEDDVRPRLIAGTAVGRARASPPPANVVERRTKPGPALLLCPVLVLVLTLLVMLLCVGAGWGTACATSARGVGGREREREGVSIFVEWRLNSFFGGLGVPGAPSELVGCPKLSTGPGSPNDGRAGGGGGRKNAPSHGGDSWLSVRASAGSLALKDLRWTMDGP